MVFLAGRAWTQMLVTCRMASGRWRQRGYSLLELLVVLSILGMTSAIVVTGLATTYRAWEWNNIRADVLQRVRATTLLAFESGRPLEINGAVDLAGLQEGVSLSFNPPLVINHRGVCQGSLLTIRYLERQRTVRLEPPYCIAASEVL